MGGISFLLISVCLCVTITQAANPALDGAFQDFVKKHNKNYTSQAHQDERRAAFEANYAYIQQHNSNRASGYTLGINEFSDMTPEQFSKVMNGYRPPKDMSGGVPFKGRSTRTVPAAIDWRTQNRVTPIKNQGECGSCWAFATTAVMEGQLAGVTGHLVSLSEQQIIDCDHNTGDHGCNGGSVGGAIASIYTNGGQDTEACYPYNNQNTLAAYSCRFSKSSSCLALTLSSPNWGYVTNPTDMQTVVATVGPIAVGIDASQASFHSYSGGVYCNSKCVAVDHVITVVGYGTYNGEQMWIVKNSWGTSWGMGGYAYIARNMNCSCFVETVGMWPYQSVSAPTTTG